MLSWSSFQCRALNFLEAWVFQYMLWKFIGHTWHAPKCSWSWRLSCGVVPSCSLGFVLFCYGFVITSFSALDSKSHLVRQVVYDVERLYEGLDCRSKHLVILSWTCLHCESTCLPAPMPLHKRKPFPLADPPKDLDPNELVYQIRFTKEIFCDYQYPFLLNKSYYNFFWQCCIM